MRLLIALSFLGLSACAMIERSAQSGYMYENDGYQRSADIYQQKALPTESEAREELGMLGRSLEDDERAAVETRIRLKRQEAKLATKREKQQYYQVRSALKNDRERLHFLSLPTFEARERWAAGRGLGVSEEAYSEDVAKTIESNDIALGMSQKAVMESWGDPDAVEIAGNAVYGLERWKYNRYVSGNEGYQKELRVVYFEGGRVVGWERP
ncbi:MAG TPA: hypothetical protein PKC28_02385 [Bdellovibrionales bacterium]|nr:hypothetical protein [Bdellovibrionales bacterium]